MAFQAKRKFKRSVQREAVRLLTPSGLEYATFEDLSAGGLKLWMDHEMEPGTMIDLDFCSIRTMGRVVRSIKKNDGCFEVGVQFIDLQSSTRALIEKLVDSEEGPF
jgi:hypothetical protein